MSGPVWRYDTDLTGTCDACLREASGMYVEGEIRDNALSQQRQVCSECYANVGGMIVRGEAGTRRIGPAYARTP
jgi:hypothetical protein